MFKSITLGFSALASIALAQNPLHFISTPNSVQAGQQYTIKYTTPDTANGVKITLRDNTQDPNNLGTNQVLTADSRGGSYTWNVANDIPNGNYALAIDQEGQDENYSGIFSLSGGSSGMSSTMSSMSSMSSMTSMTSMTSSMTSATGAPSVMSRMSASTTSYPYGAGMTGSPAGTGSYLGGSMARNSSYVAPTAPPQPSGGNTGSSGGTPTSGGSGGSGSNAGSNSGSNTAAATTAAATGGAATLGSSMALVIGAVAAFAFLN